MSHLVTYICHIKGLLEWNVNTSWKIQKLSLSKPYIKKMQNVFIVDKWKKMGLLSKLQRMHFNICVTYLDKNDTRKLSKKIKLELVKLISTSVLYVLLTCNFHLPVQGMKFIVLDINVSFFLVPPLNHLFKDKVIVCPHLDYHQATNALILCLQIISLLSSFLNSPNLLFYCFSSIPWLKNNYRN